MDRTVLKLTVKASARSTPRQQKQDELGHEEQQEQQLAPGAQASQRRALDDVLPSWPPAPRAAAQPAVAQLGTARAAQQQHDAERQQPQRAPSEQQPPLTPLHRHNLQPQPRPDEADGGDAGRGDQRRPPPAGAAGGGGGGGGGGDSDPDSSDIDFDGSWYGGSQADGGDYNGDDNRYRQPKAKDNSAAYMNGVLQCLTKMTEFMEKGSPGAPHAAAGPILRPTKLPQLQLPKLTGSYEEWPQWYANWRAKVDSRSEISSLDKMLYLLSCLQPHGPAHQAVAGLSVDSDSYEIAIQTLRRKYSNRKILLGDIFGKIIAYPMIKSMGAARIALDFLKTQIRSFKTHDVQMEDPSFNALLLFILESKFPGPINTAWQKMQVRKEEESGAIEYSRDHFSAPFHHSYTVMQFLTFTENMIIVHENSSLRPQPTTADAGKRAGNADKAPPSSWKDRTRSAGSSGKPVSSPSQGSRPAGSGNSSRPPGGGGNFRNRDQKQGRFGNGGRPAGQPMKPNTPTRASPGTTKAAAAAGRQSGKAGIGTTSKELDQRTFGALFTQNCPFCNNSAKEHLANLAKCSKLHNMSVTESFARIKHFNAAKKAKCCVRCLRLGHTSMEAPGSKPGAPLQCPSTCRKCSGRHHERLCSTAAQ